MEPAHGPAGSRSLWCKTNAGSRLRVSSPQSQRVQGIMESVPSMQPDRIAIEELVYRSCLALDEKNFKAYLDLCDENFRYTITAHSPEIRKNMIWLDHDKPEMQLLFTNLPRHISDHSPLTRHAIVYTVEYAGEQRH